MQASRTQHGPPRNILFLMVDQLRPDYVGFSAQSRMPTPNLDRIAQSVAFENAISPNPVCTPARCALITGRYTHQVGMLTMSGDLSPEYRTYPQALQDAGYFTAAIGKLHLLQGWHWGQPRAGGHDLVALREQIKKFGFDDVWEAAGKQLALKNYCDYCAYLDERGLLETYRNEIERRGAAGVPEDPTPGVLSEQDHVDVVIADRVIDAIRTRPIDKPFFIFGSFLSPHPIIDPPARYYEAAGDEPEERFIVAPERPALSNEMQQRWVGNRRGYRALVNLIDDQVGRIIDVLEAEGLMEDTVIFFTSDHGDMLGDRSIDGKNLPWRASVAVPLAIRDPRHLGGRRVSDPVELTDVTATILDVAGLDPHEALARSWPSFNDIVPGRSLMPIVAGEADRVRDFAFSENHLWEMIQTAEWKHVRWRSASSDFEAPREDLYHLPTDAEEITNLIDDPRHSAAAQYCRDRRDWILNRTVAGQRRWAPILADEGMRGDYPGIAPIFPRVQPAPPSL